MRVHYVFESSHQRSGFPSEQLLFTISSTPASHRHRLPATVSFEVPSDFHVHNDLVAAALLTLVGNTAERVTFDFPISARCAELLCGFYELHEAGPVDPLLEPRQPGKYLGLNFSGGVDSTGVLLLLRSILGAEFRVLTSNYGDPFDFEKQGFLAFPRDITSRTDLRIKRFDRDGRFNSCVPLLFADYLDLRAQVTGHTYTQVPVRMAAMQAGGVPEYHAFDSVLLAGGLEELHLVRCLWGSGTMALLAALGPQHAAAAFAACAPRGLEKHVTKGLQLRAALDRHGHDGERLLPSIAPLRRGCFFGESLATDMRLIALVRSQGREPMLALCPELRRLDFAALDALLLDLFWRYNPSLIDDIPPDIRPAVLAVFQQCGILPYSERDVAEHNRLREILQQARVPYL